MAVVSILRVHRRCVEQVTVNLNVSDDAGGNDEGNQQAVIIQVQRGNWTASVDAVNARVVPAKSARCSRTGVQRIRRLHIPAGQCVELRGGTPLSVQFCRRRLG